MALTRAEGFGHLRDAHAVRGYYDTIEDTKEDFCSHYVFPLEELGGLGSEEVQFALRSFDVLAEATSEPALIHHSLQSGNVLLSRPLTIIDPHPFVGHPCLALARPAAALGASGVQPLLQGFRRYCHVDSALLCAAIRVRMIPGMFDHLKRGNTRRFDQQRAFFVEADQF